jgi:site-specific DNA-methyltransferase (adenine-specific)
MAGGGTLLGKQKREADSAGGLINTTLKVNHATGGVFKKYEAIFSEPEITIERTGGTWASKYGKKCQHWDIAPPEEYFTELFRVSKNQIIWGGNYFGLPPTRCFVVWRKLTISEEFSMAMCEYAWTSFNDNAKWFECAPQGTKNVERFHPTQKPVALYEWLLSRYAKPGDKILDTHVGSASSLIACHRLNHPFVGFEIDKEYYDMASKRLEAEQAQSKLFG